MAVSSPRVLLPLMVPWVLPKMRVRLVVLVLDDARRLSGRRGDDPSRVIAWVAAATAIAIVRQTMEIGVMLRAAIVDVRSPAAVLAICAGIAAALAARAVPLDADWGFSLAPQIVERQIPPGQTPGSHPPRRSSYPSSSGSGSTSPTTRTGSTTPR